MARECSIILGGDARLHGKDDKELKWHEGGNSLEDIWEISVPDRGNRARWEHSSNIHSKRKSLQYCKVISLQLKKKKKKKSQILCDWCRVSQIERYKQHGQRRVN